jgi:hypothetical protein
MIPRRIPIIEFVANLKSTVYRYMKLARFFWGTPCDVYQLRRASKKWRD